MKFSLLLPLIWTIHSVAGEFAADKINYVGCFDIEYSVTHRYLRHIADVNLEKCATYCSALRTRYAGIEKGDNLCYCGSDIAERSTKKNESLCATPCTDYEQRSCGGEELMSLYDILGEPEDHDGDEVHFLVGTSVGVRQYHSNGRNSFDNIQSMTGEVLLVDYHLGKNLVFFISENKLFQTTLEEKPTYSGTPTTFIRNMATSEGFVVDWIHDKIYWMHWKKNTIMVMDFDGENLNEVLKRPREISVVKRMEVDPYRGMLFWIATDVLETCELSGENFTSLSPSGMVVNAFTLDMDARLVYYVGTSNHTTALYSVDYNGHNHSQLFIAPKMNRLYGMGVVKGDVYWDNYEITSDYIYKTPLNLNGSEITQVAIIDKVVWHMKILHPSVQQQPCKNKGCSHSCVAQSPTTASCDCPENQELHEDGLTCYRNTDHEFVA